MQIRAIGLIFLRKMYGSLSRLYDSNNLKYNTIDDLLYNIKIKLYKMISVKTNVKWQH